MTGSAEENLGQLLLQAFWWLDQRATAELDGDGGVVVSAAQALTLTRISPDGTRPVDLARAAGVSRQAVHQTLNDLEKAGLVRRDAVTKGQGVLVRLTDDGRQRANAVLAADAASEAALAERIGADRVEALRLALASDWGEP